MSEGVLQFFGTVIVLSVLMVLVWRTMIWREERGYLMSRRSLDREWCWHYRYFGKGWEDLAADIEKAGAVVHPWIEAEIAEARLGQAEYCKEDQHETYPRR